MVSKLLLLDPAKAPGRATLVRVLVAQSLYPEALEMLRKTPLDLPIIVLMCGYLLSFNNVSNAYALGQGLFQFSTIVASVSNPSQRSRTRSRPSASGDASNSRRYSHAAWPIHWSLSSLSP